MDYPQNINEWPRVESYKKDFRPELLEMANAITRLELWEFFRQDTPPRQDGYFLWQHPNLANIGREIQTSHSGATFAFSCRHMQYIAKNGFQAYQDAWRDT
jgi:hypothetical protein